ncbi:MAG: CarD family transcriptional regulator [Actinobacteria bacterium]|nr:CarD family transcriptional regulator [Actinomycetota bacterium]
MKPSVGEVIVHPQHGTAEVTALETREVGGVAREYVVLRRTEDSLTLHVPIEALEDLGLRETIDVDDVSEVFDILRAEPQLLSMSWRKQHAKNESRLNSGKVRLVAAAVRDLKARDDHRGLSPSDGRIYRDARERLIEEVVAATGRSTEDVEREVDEALAEMAERHSPAPA